MLAFCRASLSVCWKKLFLCFEEVVLQDQSGASLLSRATSDRLLLSRFQEKPIICSLEVHSWNSTICLPHFSQDSEHKAALNLYKKILTKVLHQLPTALQVNHFHLKEVSNKKKKSATAAKLRLDQTFTSVLHGCNSAQCKTCNAQRLK